MTGQLLTRDITQKRDKVPAAIRVSRYRDHQANRKLMIVREIKLYTKRKTRE